MIDDIAAPERKDVMLFSISLNLFVMKNYLSKYACVCSKAIIVSIY